MKRESGSGGGAVLLLARGGPGPWKEFVEAIVGPEIDQASEDIGKPGLGIDAGQFGGFDERGEDGPIFGAVVVTGEESILARQGYCPFILPMSGGSWKSTTGIIPISAARSWCVAWSSARQANSVVCKGRQASWYRLPVGCSIPWFVRE